MPNPYTFNTSASKLRTLSTATTPSSQTTPPTRNTLLFNLNDVRYFNAQLAQNIAQMVAISSGETREKIKVPICPTETVSDQVLFEDPADANKKYYLPRYSLAQTDGNVEVRLAKSGKGWSLSLLLNKAPATELGEKARTANELPHDIRVFLKHLFFSGDPKSGYKTLPFQEVTETSQGTRAVLRVETIRERDVLYQALTDDDYRTSLTVQRKVNVAVPATDASQSAQPAPQVISSGTTTLRLTMALDFDTGKMGNTGDVVCQQKTSVIPQLIPQNKAKVCNLGYANFNGLIPDKMKTLRYSNAALGGVAQNDPKSLLFVTPNWNPGGRGRVYNNHPIGIWFAQSKGTWSVINQDRAAMPASAAFNIDVRTPGSTVFVHKATVSNIVKHMTYLNHRDANNNPNAVLFVTPNWNPGTKNGVYHKSPFGVWYDKTKKKWAIYNQNRATMPNNAAFNIEVCSRAGGSVFVHKAGASSIARNSTYINHALTNGKPYALLTVTANWNPGGVGGVYNIHHFGVWYDSNKKQWAIYNQDKAVMPTNAAFNVQVRKIGATAFVHKATSSNLSGHYSFIDRPTVPGKNSLSPGTVFAVQTNAGNYAKVRVLSADLVNLKIHWVTYSKASLDPQPLFRQVTRALDCTLERMPFFFPSDLYGYIFQVITGASAQSFTPKLRQLSWKKEGEKNHRIYHYYQDAAEPCLFHYFPESFKIARKPSSPHHPIMPLRFASADGAEENLMATLEFTAVPYTDPDRLEAAERGLEEFVSAEDLSTGNGIQLHPYPNGKTELILFLPGGDGSAHSHKYGEDEVDIDLQSGFTHSVTLSMQKFYDLWDAIYGGSLKIFQGHVELALTDDKSETIDFIAQMDDLAGEIFDCTQKVDQSSGTISVTLTNGIESPIQIDRLGAKFCRIDTDSDRPVAGTSVDAEISGLTLPVERLEPGESITFTIKPAANIPGKGAISVLYDFDDVVVMPDKDAIFDAILPETAMKEYTKEVTVSTEYAFEDAQVQKVTIDFGPGEDIVFKRGDEQLEKQVLVKAPIKGLLTDEVQTDEFNYSITVVRSENGKSDKYPLEDDEREWRSGSSDYLEIMSDDLPKKPE